MKINIETIIKDTDPIIRTQSADVVLPLSKEEETLAMEMRQYVIDSVDPEKAEKMKLRPAVGISAIQVGVAKKITAVVFTDYDKNGEEVKIDYVLANAKIVSSSEQKAYLKAGEGCLSVESDHEGYVPRSARITVEAYDVLNKKPIRIRARGYLAIVLQHEIEHFSGTLFYDHINRQNPFAEIENAIVIE